ncbi:hypothetical protein EH222_06625 [candidate division KSB1 bacterium]|nr:MAG: hypothetical protein EH222_06625 [candidate division KSB1 bacterium]
MGLYWKSVIVKVTGCDYSFAGKIEKLIETLYPDCTEVQLVREAPIAMRALMALDEMSRNSFSKPYDSLTVDEFCELHELYQKQSPWDVLRFAA